MSIGPKTTIRHSCADCDVCQGERYTCQSDSGTDVYCAHPSLPTRRIIGDSRWDTPPWCPAEPKIAARADARIAQLESDREEGITCNARLSSELGKRDAQIAELERECAQWRLELRIYREAEDARIAELEQSVTVRDTEIARLETDLELARRDANLHKQILRAAEFLPDRCEIQLTVENGSGWVELFTGHAWVEPSPDGDLAEQVSECIDRALEGDAARAGNGGEG